MTETIIQTIRQLEDELQEATIQNDVERTDDLLAEDWLNINATGTITTKAESLAIMPKFEFLSITNDDVQIRVYPGIAIVTGHSIRQLKISDDQAKTSAVLFTRVWVQLDGRWQVITSQATPVAQA